jgi:hypothetical protein
MPTYNFQHKTTGEIIEKSLRIAERDEWLKDNLEWQQVHLDAPAMGDSVRLGVRKHDQGFKEVLHKIHERSPGSRLKDNIR